MRATLMPLIPLTCLVLAVPAFCQAPAKDAAPAAAVAKEIPRMPDGKPNLQGFWNIQYVPNMGLGKEAEIPYTPAGKKAYVEHDAKDDPTSWCHYPGVPRVMSSPYPVQILQTPEYVILAHEYMKLWRVIPTDHRPHPENAPSSFMGDSTGWWEGDTFVIETVALNDHTWLDTAGHQHTDQMRVIEKLHWADNKKDLELEFTIYDPPMYTKPWTHKRTWQALRPAQAPGLPMILEYECQENNKDLEHLMSLKPGAE
jgi:hypothetical protein